MELLAGLEGHGAPEVYQLAGKPGDPGVIEDDPKVPSSVIAVPVVYDDVLVLDVPVEDAAGVQVVQGGDHLQRFASYSNG